MRPVGRNVLIKPFKDEIMYMGTIHLVDTARSRACDGVVLKIGERCTQVQPGDWVVYSRKQATDVKYDSFDCILIDERAIAAVILHEEDK